MKKALLSHNPLFASLSDAELENLIAVMRQVDLPPDTVLFREGDYGERFYIVVDGQLDIIKAFDTPDERLLHTSGPGDCFGEMGILDPERLRSATVRSRSHARLLEMTKSDFDELLHRKPDIAFDVARTLCRYLHNTDKDNIRFLEEKNRQLAKAFEDLRNAQDQIIEKEKLEHELQLAREIQESLLPRSLPVLPGFDFGARVVPAKAVGGDFFDFIRLDKDSLGIAIGDVSDKGVPAAIFMATTRSLLRAEAKAGRSPAEVLQDVNRHLLSMNESQMFVTVLYGVLYAPTRLFSYARAGHTPPVVSNTSGNLIVPTMQSGQPIGILAKPELDSHVLELSPGSTMLIYTDGMTDARNNAGELFGAGRLYGEFSAHRFLSAEALCESLVKAVLDYYEEGTVLDDMALVAVHVRP
ncbi:MAG: SpoIIE family protein phosphatase [Deltaproteobacteria bacterium]|jgi:serine phosphatase RsbU (regulator of sigma subunit)|nr:SpoIIE family protein phosphatase [Deltaproteobacteria bacterium]